VSLHELPDPHEPAGPDLRLAAEVDATRAVVDDLRAAMARLEGVTGYLQTRLEEVTAERDELVRGRSALDAELATARAELAKLTERAEQEQNRRFTLESEVDDLRSDLAATESEVATLRTQAEELRLANAALVAQRTELVSQRARKYRSLPVPGE